MGNQFPGGLDTTGINGLYHISRWEASKSGTDWGPALNQAHTDLSDGDIIFIPPGVYEIATPVVFDGTRIGMVGSGKETTIFEINLSSTANAFHIGNETSTWYSSSRFGQFGMFGGADCCKNALKISKVTRTAFRDIIVGTGAAEYNIWLEAPIGCIFSHFGSTQLDNSTYTSGEDRASGGGVKITPDPDDAIYPNANVFLKLFGRYTEGSGDGTGGTGVYWDAAGAAQGHNVMFGVLCEDQDYGFETNGVNGVYIFGFHGESNNNMDLILNGSDSHIISYSACDMSLTGGALNTIEGQAKDVTIDSGVGFTDISKLGIEGTLTDNGDYTKRSNSTGLIMYPHGRSSPTLNNNEWTMYVDSNGDLIVEINSGGTVKTKTLADFSAL